MDNRKETAAAPISRINYSDLAKAIAGVLISAPMTAAEINAALGTDYAPLQISNAMQRISGVSAGREVRMAVGASGQRREKEYAVYTLCGTGEVSRPSAGAMREKKLPQAAEGKKTPLPEYIAAERRKRGKATAERAEAIAKVLGSEPMTMREINAALGTDYSALQVADAVKKYIPGAESCKVWRMVTNSRGEKVERVYAAYFLK